MNNIYNGFTGLHTNVQIAVIAGIATIGVAIVCNLPKLASAVASSGGKIEINNNGFSIGAQDSITEEEKPLLENKD